MMALLLWFVGFVEVALFPSPVCHSSQTDMTCQTQWTGMIYNPNPVIRDQVEVVYVQSHIGKQTQHGHQIDGVVLSNS
jgi:hypothetical protein